MEAVRAWVSFVCVACRTRRNNEDYYSTATGDPVCGECIGQYKECNDCKLLLRKSYQGGLCTDCKE